MTQLQQGAAARPAPHDPLVLGGLCRAPAPGGRGCAHGGEGGARRAGRTCPDGHARAPPPPPLMLLLTARRAPPRAGEEKETRDGHYTYRTQGIFEQAAPLQVRARGAARGRGSSGSSAGQHCRRCARPFPPRLATKRRWRNGWTRWCSTRGRRRWCSAVRGVRPHASRVRRPFAGDRGARPAPLRATCCLRGRGSASVCRSHDRPNAPPPPPTTTRRGRGRRRAPPQQEGLQARRHVRPAAPGDAEPPRQAAQGGGRAPAGGRPRV